MLGASVVAAVGDITADQSADLHSRKKQSVLPHNYVNILSLFKYNNCASLIKPAIMYFRHTFRTILCVDAFVSK